MSGKGGPPRRKPPKKKAKKPAAKKRAGGLPSSEKALAAAAVTSSTKLTTRQEKLRKILIASNGLIDMEATAKELGVNRVQVWQDKRRLAAFGPPRPLDGWDEDQAISQALDFYESACSLLIAQVAGVMTWDDARRREVEEGNETRERVYREAIASGGNPSPPIFDHYSPARSIAMNVSLMNCLAVFRRDLNTFLTTIGLIREAPQRIELIKRGGVESAETVEEIGEALADIKSELRSIRARKRAAMRKNGNGGAK